MDIDTTTGIQKPGLSIFIITALLSAGVSLVLATYVLGLTSSWMSISVGALCGIVGLFMGENIGDAIVFTLVVALIVLLVLTVLPVIQSLRIAIVPVATGFCLGKLASGVWKELSLRKRKSRS